MMAQEKQQESSRVDVVVVGGGYVGLSLAVALKAAAAHLDVLVIEAALKDAWKRDPRASAIAAATVRMLRQMGCWQQLEGKTQAITDMIITDSRVADPVRPTFLTFAGELNPGEAFAYMVENCYLNAALHSRAQALGVCVREATRVECFTTDETQVRVFLDDGTVVAANLLVGADGVRSKMREAAGIKTLYWPYGQMGIVCTVKHERSHHGRAIEHFLPAGPFAILPLPDNRSSLVWNEGELEAKKLMQADDMVFEAELEMRFGYHLGALELEGARRAFPFGLTLVRDFVRPRFALVGDAAHGIHPISGQGLNLGFRDVAALVQIVVETNRLGLDIGTMTALGQYERWRRFETVRMGVTTDVLNRLFSNDSVPLRAIRDFGLGVIDRINFVKNYFIKEAAGMTPNAPRLLLGEPI